MDFVGLFRNFQEFQEFLRIFQTFQTFRTFFLQIQPTRPHTTVSTHTTRYDKIRQGTTRYDKPQIEWRVTEPIKSRMGGITLAIFRLGKWPPKNFCYRNKRCQQIKVFRRHYYLLSRSHSRSRDGIWEATKDLTRLTLTNTVTLPRSAPCSTWKGIQKA